MSLLPISYLLDHLQTHSLCTYHPLVMDHTAEISREGSEVITIPSLPDFQPICRSHDIEELPFHHSFPQFRRLSMELRLMIWELT